MPFGSTGLCPYLCARAHSSRERDRVPRFNPPSGRPPTSTGLHRSARLPNRCPLCLGDWQVGCRRQGPPSPHPPLVVGSEMPFLLTERDRGRDFAPPFPCPCPDFLSEARSPGRLRYLLPTRAPPITSRCPGTFYPITCLHRHQERTWYRCIALWLVDIGVTIPKDLLF